MRILFDSKKKIFKDPFGTLCEGQECTLHIHIPQDVGALKAECMLFADDGSDAVIVTMEKSSEIGAYDIFEGSFSLEHPALYFYHFVIYKENGSFRLFKYGNDTNMEAGEQWQLL